MLQSLTIFILRSCYKKLTVQCVSMNLNCFNIILPLSVCLSLFHMSQKKVNLTEK